MTNKQIKFEIEDLESEIEMYEEALSELEDDRYRIESEIDSLRKRIQELIEEYKI